MPGDCTAHARLLADAFYRTIASRYERRSRIVTSNESFESWDKVFPDPVLASAVLDRLVHHAHFAPILGEFFRTKGLETRQRGDAQPKKRARHAASHRSPAACHVS